MTCKQAGQLMNGDRVRAGDSVGLVDMPRRPNGWFKVNWEHGTQTTHEIAAPHSVADLEIDDDQPPQ